MRGKPKQAYDAIDAMLNAIDEWQEKVDLLVTTGEHDADVIATHDAQGRLIELLIRPGLQQELTTEELEDEINAAMAENAVRAQARMQAISDEFLDQFVLIPEDLGDHPAADRLAAAYHAAIEVQKVGRSS
jgi:DNA-binding protein YbaB